MITALVMAAAIAHPPPPVRGDFDRDGRIDRAEVVRRPGGGFAVVVWRAARPRHPELVYAMKGPLGDFYLDTAKPGVWRTACGKGYDIGGPCRRKTVRLTGDTLDFGTRESSEAVALWIGRRFEVEWISD